MKGSGETGPPLAVSISTTVLPRQRRMTDRSRYHRRSIEILSYVSIIYGDYQDIDSKYQCSKLAKYTEFRKHN